ncbi:unnamed protein product [Alopecurus aequalis]
MASAGERADRFDVSGPAHIMYTATAGHPAPLTMIDWLRKFCESITHSIMSRATTAGYLSPTMIHWLRDFFGSTIDITMSGATDGHPSPTLIDWNNEEHRRCIAASLVQGTYIIEKDRTNSRVSTEALAPQWWESFGFRLREVLQDEDSEEDKGNKSYIFGAIFEHVPLADAPHHPSAPQFIVAFRGTTMLSNPNSIQNIQLDLNIIANTLPSCKRTTMAREAVATITKGKGGGSLWLTGHSVGASLALDLGRAMMSDEGLNIPTFLFNPPQVSLGPAINLLLPSDKVWREMQLASNIVKAGLGMVLSPHRKRMEAVFERLSPWAPNMYVHDKDLVCQGFINYFEQRQQMQERFHSSVAKSSASLSYSDMLFSTIGKEKESSHLLPSATLWKTSCIRKDAQGLQQTSFAAHELQQWWKTDAELGLSNKRYSLP